MLKRGMIFGTYHTAARDWTLTGWTLSAPETKTHYIDKPGGDGSWDFTTALTGGLPRFHNRELTATFELSVGDRMAREREIRSMINQLHGLSMQIELPDDEEHYLVGRLHVAKLYNDNAHAAVEITATCEPWKYKYAEAWMLLAAMATPQTAVISNTGRREVVPTFTVTGEAVIGYGKSSWALGAGTHVIPDLQLVQGEHIITYSGSGTIKLTYREAVLE